MFFFTHYYYLNNFDDNDTYIDVMGVFIQDYSYYIYCVMYLGKSNNNKAYAFLGATFAFFEEKQKGILFSILSNLNYYNPDHLSL